MSDDDPNHGEQEVANARALLADYDECTVEERYGAIKHAITELKTARRRLPDDY